MSKIWSTIKTCCRALFCRETVSRVWEILFNGGKSTVTGILTDTELMNAAFDLAKSLASSDVSSDEKKDAFNAHLKSYMRERGIEVGTSVLNVVRETALSAVYAEAETAK